jgi:Tol biopolymer transport system component/mono/diheme cytochrome c family protein
MSRRIVLCLLMIVLVRPMISRTQTQIPRAAASQASATARVTFSETVAPIVYAKCVTCHRPGEAAPFSLISYEDVAKRGALIAKVTAARYMPPWHAEPGFGEFVGERRLSDAQIATLAAWVKQGMPRGDASKMPKLPVFPADGWQLGQPDLVLEMPAGFDVPASGPDVFRNFVIPTRLTEDRWVRGIEFRPSARKVVHHAIFAQVPGGSRAALDGADGRPGFGGLGAVGVVGDQTNSPGLGGWAVGATPQMFPSGMAARLPKGSDFLLQMHFHPSGRMEVEKSQIGIYFTDKPSEKDVLSVELPALFGIGAGIDIPPGEKQFTIKDSFTLPGDVRVYMAIAHAHYLATQMNATATLPDGSIRRLLVIRDWDFNWQDSYIYKEPFGLPKGTRLDVTLTYDNSAGNPRNPISPPRRALFGEQSLDEMGAVGFTFEVLHKDDVPYFQQALGERAKTAIQAAGQNGALGRFLARRARDRRGLQQLTLFDRQGTVVGRVGEPGQYSQAAFSPDGSRLAVIKRDPDTDGQDVWTFDIATGKGVAITSDTAPDSAPIWSPDAKQIAYVSIRENTPAIYRRSSTGAGAEELLYQHNNGALIVLTDWSADGRFLCFWSGDEMFVLPLTGERKVIALGKDPFFGRGGRFSPDGHLLAFNSNQSGRFQVYVNNVDSVLGNPVATSSPSQNVQVSNDTSVGGIFWRRDGKELFFLSLPPNQSVMAVDVATGPTTFRASAPSTLFKLPTPVGAPAQLSSVSSPDGQRFVFAVNVPTRPAGSEAPAAR